MQRGLRHAGILMVFIGLTIGFSACDDEFKINPPTTTINAGEIVYQKRIGSIRLSFAADSTLTAFDGSSYANPLGVTGRISPADLIDGIEVEQRTHINNVFVRTHGLDGPETLRFNVDEVEYRGINLVLKSRTGIIR